MVKTCVSLLGTIVFKLDRFLRICLYLFSQNNNNYYYGYETLLIHFECNTKNTLLSQKVVQGCTRKYAFSQLKTVAILNVCYAIIRELVTEAFSYNNCKQIVVILC